MAHTITHTLKAGSTVSITFTPTAHHVRDVATSIDWHVDQICKLADQYVSRQVYESKYNGNPQKIAWHEKQLSALGICKTTLYSFVNRAETI